MIGNALTAEPEGIAGTVTPERIERITSRYRNTPTTDPDDIPRGRYMHTSGGIWLHRCRSCDDYILSYGAVMYLYPFAVHEATHEELRGNIPGYDLALMP